MTSRATSTPARPPRSRPRDKPLGMAGRRLGSSSRPPMPRKAPFSATPPCETPSPAAPPASPMTMPAIPRTPSLSSTLAAANLRFERFLAERANAPLRVTALDNCPDLASPEIGALMPAFPHSLRSSSAASKTKEEDASGQGANPPEKDHRRSPRPRHRGIPPRRHLRRPSPPQLARPRRRLRTHAPSAGHSPCAPGFSRGSSAPCDPAALPSCRSGSS